MRFQSKLQTAESTIKVTRVNLIQNSSLWRLLRLSGSLANNSFLHVFVNVSSIKRLEKERATNKCLHIMFASISHEFRTPLNAFMNAVDLIQLNHNSAFELISDNSKGKNESQIKRIFESTRGFLYSQLDQWIQLQNWSQVSFLIIPNMYMQSKGECIMIDVQKTWIS